jgi:hypothetical protein
VLPGIAHHVTERGNNRQRLLFSDEDRTAYLDRMFAQSSEVLIAICSPVCGGGGDGHHRRVSAGWWWLLARPGGVTSSRMTSPRSSAGLVARHQDAT